MPDDPSVLGNLPRSRPGRRSDKRSAAKPAARSAAKPRSSAKPAAARSKPKPPAASKERARARSVATEPPPTQRPAAPTDPVSGAIRLAGQVAGAGFKVAGEVLKRLPRP